MTRIEDGPQWSGLRQRRRVRRMLRRMERLDHKAIHMPRQRSDRDGRRVRWFSAALVGIAGSAVGVAMIASQSAEIVHDRVWTVGAAPRGWPDEPTDIAEQPLARPPAVTGAGTHEFLATQGESADPVAYSPCQPIHLEVNARTAIPGHMEILERAVADVSRASGLQFVVDGETDRIPEHRAPRPASDGRGWEPVLVAWSDEAEVPDLAGTVAGVGGSARASRAGREWLVTGSVILDGVDLARMADQPDGQSAVRAVVMHEFGHLLGLDHVSDRGQLMHGENIGQREFGDGDLAGLAKAGSGECVDW